jgi:hypothetical protein
MPCLPSGFFTTHLGGQFVVPSPNSNFPDRTHVWLQFGGLKKGWVFAGFEQPSSSSSSKVAPFAAGSLAAHESLLHVHEEDRPPATTKKFDKKGDAVDVPIWNTIKYEPRMDQYLLGPNKEMRMRFQVFGIKLYFENKHSLSFRRLYQIMPSLYDGSSVLDTSVYMDRKKVFTMRGGIFWQRLTV